MLVDPELCSHKISMNTKEKHMRVFHLETCHLEELCIQKQANFVVLSAKQYFLVCPFVGI